jgi:hypothetical protein
LLSEIPATRKNTKLAEETGISLNGKELPFCAHDEVNKMIQDIEEFNLSSERNISILKYFLPMVYAAFIYLCIVSLCIELTPFLCSGKFRECGLVKLK